VLIRLLKIERKNFASNPHQEKDLSLTSNFYSSRCFKKKRKKFVSPNSLTMTLKCTFEILMRKEDEEKDEKKRRTERR